MSSTHEVTLLLARWAKGNQEALNELTPLVYKELRQLAASYLRKERQDHTLQPTALVHEAYLRLVDQSGPNWQNRSHFYGVAARLMRQILVIGIGAAVTRRPLPHHRAYGSVHGGSRRLRCTHRPKSEVRGI